MEFQNLDDLKKLRVVDLKERLAKLGKSTSGLKADLVDRLYNALAEKAGQVDLSAAAPSYVQMCNMSSMEPEPPVVEVTIDTSQFDMSVQEPQIVTMGQYNVIDNVPDMNAELDQEQAYYQRQEETERLRLQQEELWRQQREEQLHRQQEAERYHQQQEFQRLELERIQREEEEAERLRLMQEEEMELRRQQEEMELRRQQEEEMRRQQQEEEMLRRQQEEEMRRQQEEEMRRQQEEEMRRQQEEEMRRQQEEEMRRIQEGKELERQEEERRRILEEEYRRRQEEEEYRMRQEEEMRRKYEEELDRQREQRELERHLEMERQRQLEQKERELELERQRELDKRRELELELERQRQIEYERLELERQREQLERQRELEQIELERQKEIELLKKREMDRRRELELEAEKLKELEKEKERQRQLEREQERQRKLEAEEAEQKRLYELELQRKAEEERMHALYEEEVRRDRDEQMRQQEEFQRRQQEEAWRKEQEEAELRQNLIAESEANREKEMEEEYENDINDSAPIQQEVEKVVNSYSASVITHTGTPMDLSATRVVEPESTDNGTEDSRSQESESGDADKSLETVNNEKNKENLVSETNQKEESVNNRGPRQPKVKLTKSEKRKLKKKRRQQNRRDHVSRSSMNADDEANEGAEPDVEVQYVGDKVDLNPTDPMYQHFMKIFEAFKLTDPEQAKREAEEAAARAKLEAKKEPDLRKKPKDADEEPELEPKKDEQPKLSKRKLKQLTRLSIAELKQHVNRPDVVEMHDVTAKDPKLLVLLKSTRNTVPVPRHWCFKRKFLQGKRGIEKPPFNLPDFIKKTGIMEMRQALQEKEDQKTLKAKMREKVRPKMGKIDIDYQKLHDAFFKWQTKPRMTIHGDLYYEGKEYETRLKEKKPGELSDDLRTALGMPVGPGCQKIPPPWLIAMQRYGPPPSYPNLKIPGLNSPIPDSCSFGYHAGGWGKPPVDEMGRPLYGDVFGTTGSDYQQSLPEEEVDRAHWGELESESESESEPEEEEEEPGENEEDIDKEGLVTPADGGLATPSGLSSVSMGMETPDMIELRKRKIENEMETGENPSLYTILPEKKTDRLGGVMMGSTHVYDITAAMPAKVRTSASHGGDGGVDVALDPSELDMDTATMTARYEQTLREQRSQLEKEDLSDMVAEHTAKQKNKRKRAAGQEINRSGKKYKDFKF